MAQSRDTWSAARVVAVTPSDSVSIVMNGYCRALFVGVGGDVSAVLEDGTSGTFKNVASGQLLPVQVTRVNATGTTATNILALG